MNKKFKQVSCLYYQKSKNLLNKKKELPYLLQKWNAIFGIAGACLGVILSGWAIGISIQAGKNATKIEKMDSLIGLLALQSRKQDLQLKKLTSLQESSFQTNYKMTDEIAILKQQAQKLIIQNSLTNQILSRLERQAKLTNEQLALSKRADKSLTIKYLSERNTTIQKLKRTFAGIIKAPTLSSQVMMYNKKYTSNLERIKTAKIIELELVKELNNPVLLSDNIIRAGWVKYFNYVSNTGNVVQYSYVFLDSTQFNQFVKPMNPIFFNSWKEFEKLGPRIEKLEQNFLDEYLQASK